MEKNTWGFQFVKINKQEDGFDTLLSLNIGDEQETRKMFGEIANEYGLVKGGPGGTDYLIDLLDDEDSIVDDIAVTREEAIVIASRLGHQIN